MNHVPGCKCLVCHPPAKPEGFWWVAERIYTKEELQRFYADMRGRLDERGIIYVGEEFDGLPPAH